LYEKEPELFLRNSGGLFLSKRRKQGKRGRAAKRVSGHRTPVEHGFDFGIELRLLLASDLSFIQWLKQADVVACAYRYNTDNPLGTPIREIALTGLHGEPLVKAFREFQRWSPEDGDAVELTFIILKDSGYLLIIQRESSRAIRDLRGSDRTYSPILMEGCYIKKFDTRHPALDELREFKRKFLISPFLFTAATTERHAIPSLNAVRPVEVGPILKFEAEFLDENSILPGTPDYQLLTLVKNPKRAVKDRGSLPEPERQKPATYFLRRKKLLGRHFPVTIERIRTGRYSAMMQLLQLEGVKDWQFEQAACNMLLSASLCGGRPFYASLKSKDFINDIAHAIGQREENSETPEVTQFSITDLISQVRLDALALLNEQGHIPSSPTLPILQEQLTQLGLLESPNA
jgi:hypothetical protein